MKLTAYTFWITQTPLVMDAAEATIAGIEWEWAGSEAKVRLDTEMEEVFSLETDDRKQIEDIKRRMDEWRKDGLAYAYQIVEGIRVEQHQYMRDKSGSNKRIWHEVRGYDQSYKTIRYALTGKDY